MPPPEPRSSTISPCLSSASAVGVPQPSDARTAVSGRPLFWDSSYKSLVIGSTSVPQQPEAPQLEFDPPDATRLAASPYFSFTTSVIPVLIGHSPHIRMSECNEITSARHICQRECV